MKTEDCYYLGYVTKLFGYKGEVVLFLDTDDPEYYKKLESVFILLKEKLVPFFIESIQLRPNNNEAVIRFQTIDNQEKAQLLVSQEVYLPLQMLPKLEGNKFYFHEIIGFQVVDSKKGNLGPVEGILEFPNNPVIQIRIGDKEALVPARDEFIENLDRKNRILYIDAPQGLIDIYLEDK
jgi:16S rRNA processing protein RimM